MCMWEVDDIKHYVCRLCVKVPATYLLVLHSYFINPHVSNCIAYELRLLKLLWRLYMNHQNQLIKRRSGSLGVQGRGRLLNEIFNPLIQ